MQKSCPCHQSTRGFTLVEILIVVVILGILAGIVVPQFIRASDDARSNSLKMNLHRLRTQLNIYKVHHDAYPTLENIVAQMTTASNKAGGTADLGTEGYPLGPYVQSIPVNPSNDQNTVTTGNVGTSGWYYNEVNGTILANDSQESRLY